MSHRSISHVVEPVTLGDRGSFQLFTPPSPSSGHLNQNNVNTSTPQAPRVQKLPSTFHQSTQDTSGAIHEMFETSSCVPMACLAETWVGSNDRGTTHFFQRCLLILIIIISLPIHWNVKCCKFFKIAAMKHDFKTELEPPFKSPMPFKRRWPSVSFGKMQPHWEQLGNPGSTSGRSIFSSES